MRPFTSIVILHTLCLIYALHIPRASENTSALGLDQKRQIHNADYSTSQKPTTQKSDSNSTTATVESSPVHPSTESSKEEHHKREGHRFPTPNETKSEMKYQRSRFSRKHIMQTAPVRSHPRSFLQHELSTRAIGSNKGTLMHPSRDASHKSSAASHSRVSPLTPKQLEALDNKPKRDPTPAPNDTSPKFPDAPPAAPDSSGLLALPALAAKNSRRDVLPTSGPSTLPDTPPAAPDSSGLLALPALAAKNSRRDVPPTSGPSTLSDAPPAVPVEPDVVGKLTKQIQIPAPASPQMPKRAAQPVLPPLPIPVSTSSNQTSNSARDVLPQLKERRALFKTVIARWFAADSPGNPQSIGTSKTSQHIHPVIARRWLNKFSRTRVA